MIMINLLPWRQERRDELKKQFIIMIACAAMSGILIIGSIHVYYQDKISIQAASNSYIKKEIKKLNKKIKKIKNIQNEKERLLARMEVIQQLQRDRPNVVLLFDSLVRVVPSGVNYLSVKRKGKTILIEGVADSNTRVSKLMRSLSSSEIFKKPNLKAIRVDPIKGGEDKVFNLIVKQQNRKE